MHAGGPTRERCIVQSSITSHALHSGKGGKNRKKGKNQRFEASRGLIFKEDLQGIKKIAHVGPLYNVHRV